MGALSHIEVSGLKMPNGWHARAVPPRPSFKDGDDGQRIVIDSFDGLRIRWTVQSKIFCGIRCEHDTARSSGMLGASWGAADRGSQLPSESGIETNADFKGFLHFDCPIRLS